MPEREIDINLSNTNIPAWDPDSPNYDAKAHATRIAQVLERGILADRTHVDLPSNLHGEWVNVDPIEIERMKAIGFKIDDTYAVQRGIHDGGDGSVRVGDVVFMTCHRRTKDLIDAINRKKYRDANDPKKTKEEILFRANLAKQKQQTGVEIPDIDTSELDSIYGRDIKDQLESGSLSITSGSAERLDKPLPGPNQIVFKR